MEIKEAVEYAREHGLTNATIEDWKNEMKQLFMAGKALECVEVIENALDNGYTLCKVDEALEKIENIDVSERKTSVWDSGEISAITTIERCINILKEACK